MNQCKISIEAPERYVKGAGLKNTAYLPAYVYPAKIILSNLSNTSALCSFSAALGNGIRYINNLHISGPDEALINAVKITEPDSNVGNNNVIIFANNFTLSPDSENILTFDTCLCNNYTENSIENSGSRIPHESKICFNGHLICGENVYSCASSSKACDYELAVECEDNEINFEDTTKFYIHCKAGQYDMVRSVYVRSVLDEGLVFIADSSNLEPQKVYTFDDKTVLKWDIGCLQPAEIKRIGYKVSLKNNDSLIKPGDILKNKVNSNCINNSTYTQCPSSYDYNLIVKS